MLKKIDERPVALAVSEQLPAVSQEKRTNYT